MLNNKQLILITSTLLAISQLSVGCSAEDIAVEDSSNKGILCLSLSSGDEFVKVETRAGQTRTDWSGYEFRLNDEPISFTDGKAVIPAGSYTLSATNSNSNAVDGGYGAPLYSGTSETFTVIAGETTDVTLALGAPQNAKVSVALRDEFTAKYSLETLSLSDGIRTQQIGTNTLAAFFPATSTTLTYTLTAAAKQGSYVQDITDAKGTVTIAAGTHTTITLGISPIDDNLIIIKNGGTHNGEFQ